MPLFAVRAWRAQAFPQAARPSCWRVVANKFLVPVWLCALPIMMPTPALADMHGKTSSTIKAYVKPLEFIEVTNELGVAGQPGHAAAWRLDYALRSGALRLRVTSLPNKFQARLDAPLVLQNAKNQVFRQPVVTLGTDGGAASRYRWARTPNSKIRSRPSRGRTPSACTSSRWPACPRGDSATSRVRTRGVVDDVRSGRYQALSTVLQTAGVCRGHAGQHV